MKKIVLFIFCMVCLTVAVAAKSTFKDGDTLYVSVKSAAVKSGSGSFSSTVANVGYGDVVTVIKAGDKNTQIKLSDGKTGWVSTGSLTKKKIVKSSNGSTVKASTKEIALAGKGFSAQSETAYKTQNSTLDFSKVDEIEKITVSDSVLQDFIADGNLKDGGE